MIPDMFDCNLPPYPEADIKAEEDIKWAALAGECVTRKMTKEEAERYGKAIFKPHRTRGDAEISLRHEDGGADCDGLGSAR